MKAVKKVLSDIMKSILYNFDDFICVRDEIRKFYRVMKNEKIAEFRQNSLFFFHTFIRQICMDGE